MLCKNYSIVKSKYLTALVDAVLIRIVFLVIIRNDRSN